MQKCYPLKAVKYIIPVATAGLIFSSDLLHESDKKFFNHPSLSPEHNWEESFPPNFNELNREKGTAAVSGTNPVVVFGGNNSDEMFSE